MSRGPRAARDPVREGLFADDPPRLLGSRCHACGRSAFPAAEPCPWCGAGGSSPADLGGAGTLWAWTEVLAPPPGYGGPVPFGFGVVELPAGLRVVTRLTHPVDAYRFGMPMRLRLVALRTVADGGGNGSGGEVVTYEFGPEGAP